MLLTNHMMHAQVNRIGKKVVAMQISAFFLSVIHKGPRAHIIYSRHMLSVDKHSQTCIFYYYEKNKHCINSLRCSGAALIMMLRIISARLRSVFPQLHAFSACNNHYERCISPLVWHEVLRR